VPPRRPPDASLALAALEPVDQKIVRRWLKLLGFDPDALDAVPPLRRLVGTLACLRLAAERRDMGREPAFREAARQLGQGDLYRSWLRWQKEAVRQFVGQDDGGV